MTVFADPATRSLVERRRVTRRSELDLALAQLQAIDTFNADRRVFEASLEAVTRTREMRLDAARARDVLHRQHAALVERTQAQLLTSGARLRRPARRRAVLAHRNPWFLDRVQAVFEENAVQVVALTDNGADALGILVAEQPDLALLEDTLLMVPGEEVVRQSRRFAPRALIAVQTDHGGAVARLLDAGADAVFTRQVPPRDVARSVLEIPRDRPDQAAGSRARTAPVRP